MKQRLASTSVTAATAGAAAGGIVAWLVSLIHGVDVPVGVAGGFATLGTFIFGTIFPGR